MDTEADSSCAPSRRIHIRLRRTGVQFPLSLHKKTLVHLGVPEYFLVECLVSDGKGQSVAFAALAWAGVGAWVQSSLYGVIMSGRSASGRVIFPSM